MHEESLRYAPRDGRFNEKHLRRSYRILETADAFEKTKEKPHLQGSISSRSCWSPGQPIRISNWQTLAPLIDIDASLVCERTSKSFAPVHEIVKSSSFFVAQNTACSTLGSTPNSYSCGLEGAALTSSPSESSTTI